ncbi:hypothetical protein SNEBB_011214 [Seison nebaliae]|nr:hypothetical protein SNEBB_011214 [Seison nebaliae]
MTDPIVIERDNLLNILKCVVNGIVEKFKNCPDESFGSDNADVRNLCCIIYHILNHGLRHKITWYGGMEHFSFWSILRDWEKVANNTKLTRLFSFSKDNEESEADESKKSSFESLQRLLALDSVEESFNQPVSAEAKILKWIELKLAWKNLQKVLDRFTLNQNLVMKYYNEEAILRDGQVELLDLLIPLNCIEFSFVFRNIEPDIVHFTIDYSTHLKCIEEAETKDELSDEDKEKLDALDKNDEEDDTDKISKNIYGLRIKFYKDRLNSSNGTIEKMKKMYEKVEDERSSIHNEMTQLQLVVANLNGELNSLNKKINEGEDSSQKAFRITGKNFIREAFDKISKSHDDEIEGNDKLDSGQRSTKSTSSAQENGDDTNVETSNTSLVSKLSLDKPKSFVKGLFGKVMASNGTNDQEVATNTFDQNSNGADDSEQQEEFVEIQNESCEEVDVSSAEKITPENETVVDEKEKLEKKEIKEKDEKEEVPVTSSDGN